MKLPAKLRWISRGKTMPQTGQSRKKEAAIAALLSEPTLPKAAEAASVSLSTLRRWLESDEAFARAYSDARAQLVRGATAQLRRAMSGAVSVLAAVSADGKAPAAARVAAAAKILEIGLKAVAVEDI